MKRLSLLFIIFHLSVYNAVAQGFLTYKGVVTDQGTNQPLTGIQLQMLGDRRYTAMTQEDGTFIIHVPSYASSLYVHAQEYLSQQVALPADTTTRLAITVLRDRYRPMYNDETTITANRHMVLDHTTGTTVEADIISQLSADVRAITHSAAPGMGAMMLIRGIGTLNTDAQPLIVIDGVEQDMQRFRDNLHTGQFFNLLANVSPDDIDRVEVLKNATAIYGARGANGVILITTKRGHSMATRIDANISVGMTWVPTLPTMMDTYHYRTYATEMLGGMTNADPLASYDFLNDDPNGYTYNVYHNQTDWTKEIYRQALTQNYGVNVQGGDDIGMYNLSVGNTVAQSTVKESSFSRLNLRFNTDINILRQLQTKIDISISKTSQNLFDDGVPEDFTQSTITSPTFLSLIKSPLLSPYQYNKIIGGFSSLLSEADEMFDQLGSGFSLANPVAIIKNGTDDNKNHAENTFFNVRVEPVYHFGNGWNLTETFYYSLDRQSQRYFRPYTGIPAFNLPDLGTVTSRTGSLFTKENSIISNTCAHFERIMGAHTIKASAGFRYSYFSYESNNLATQYRGETNDRNPALSTSNGYQLKDGENDIWKKWQNYLTADYNYRQRYFLSFALMAEANSRFGSNASSIKLLGTSWALFPSIQTGWIVSNEKWFPHTKGINYLRLNVGYDLSGNDDISNYAARSSLSSVVFNHYATGLKINNIGNDNIKWERTSKFNIGLQTHMLNNRLSVAFDYYHYTTNDLLIKKKFDNPVAGIGTYWTNGGKLSNIGFEATLAVKPIVANDFALEMGASVGHYINKIKELSDGNYTTSAYGDNNILTAVGQPAGLFYGYRTEGIYSTTADARKANLYINDNTGKKQYFQAGDVRFADLNDDGMISEADKSIIGNPNPDIYGNIFANLVWRDLTLSIGLNYSLGNDIYNYQRSVLNSGSALYNQQVQTQSHWRYQGQQTTQPRLNFGDPMGNNRMSDRWIEDGSYLRLKTVRLSYRVPIPASFNWLQGLSVWAEANNLLTLTHYTGCDPEVSATNDVLYQGIDTGLLPQSRSLTMGVKINL